MIASRHRNAMWDAGIAVSLLLKAVCYFSILGSRDTDFSFEQMHVGDFIYEYGADKYPSPLQAVRWSKSPLGLQPSTELIHLQDYRER